MSELEKILNIEADSNLKHFKKGEFIQHWFEDAQFFGIIRNLSDYFSSCFRISPKFYFYDSELTIGDTMRISKGPTVVFNSLQTGIIGL